MYVSLVFLEDRRCARILTVRAWNIACEDVRVGLIEGQSEFCFGDRCVFHNEEGGFFVDLALLTVPSPLLENKVLAIT